MVIPSPALITQAFDKGTAESWLEMGFQSIQAKDLKAGIRDDLSLVRLFFDLYKLDNPAVKFAAKTVLRYHFASLEGYLTNVQTVHSLLCRRPDVARIICTPEGIAWLNRQCAELYSALWGYCYE
jgi:hypothetical protein